MGFLVQVLYSFCKVLFFQRSGEGNFILADSTLDQLLSAMLWGITASTYSNLRYILASFEFEWSKVMDMYNWWGLADDF